MAIQMKENDMYIYVDDIRVPSNIPSDAVVCRTYADSIATIDTCISNGTFIDLDLDHDLGEEKSGYDIAKYIVENQYKKCRFRVHSANPVGRQNISQLVTHYGYEYIG